MRSPARFPIVLLAMLLLTVPAWSQQQQPKPMNQRVQPAQPRPLKPQSPPGNELSPSVTTGSAPQPTPAELIGWTTARQRLGEQMPTGKGVRVGIVEGDPPSYAPDPQHPSLRGVELVLRSGESQPSQHANTTAGILAGPRGLLAGLDTLDAFAVSDWLTDGYLHSNSDLPPGTEVTPIGLIRPHPMPRVFSHSWIGTDPRIGQRVCRLVDRAIEERAVIMAVGVNNGASSAVPAMLASSYNAIAVGVDTGQSSGGYTTLDAPGRCKPDLVAPGQPGNMTSFATPVVAACAAMLLEKADAMPTPTGAARPETIKAILLAGAVKPMGWSPAQGHPLDERLGAGRVNLDHALRILGTGPLTVAGGASGPLPSTQRITKAKSWLHAQLPPAKTHTYALETPVDLGELSVIITWHRRPAPEPAGDPRLADLDLLLVDADTPTPPIAASTSRVDNVEHVYLPSLPAGRYELRVTRDPAHDQQTDPWPYTIAWRLEPR